MNTRTRRKTSDDDREQTRIAEECFARGFERVHPVSRRSLDMDIRGPSADQIRGAAALCSLRGGPRSLVDVRGAVGDSLDATLDILDSLLAAGLVERSAGSWRLSSAGVGWCEGRGLPCWGQRREDARCGRRWASCLRTAR